MESEKNAEVKRMFLRVLEKPPVERETTIRHLCGEDGELAAELHSLLKADSQWLSFLDQSPLAGKGTEGEPLLGGKVGGYQLLREVGAGGMGAVFLAERVDGAYHQHVAVKIIKKGMDSEHILRRFNRERQIMANLEHPHIAKILDGGTTVDGRPFFVMEFVEGERIDAYCRNRSLPLKQRLRLFQKVCRAVSFAHRNLVVHCDLKPGNILVNHQGEPKLLDFGIAKLMEPETAPEATVTLAGLRALTPGYASPEQITGEAITTASDVYMLGILLFEILTGQRLYPFQNCSQESMRRVICEQEPPKPSQVLGRGGEFPRRWLGNLQADLDKMVGMALRKNPTLRYPSADQLAEDIDRLLAGFPVRARKITRFYTALKFYRRHRFAVMATLGGFLLLVSLSVSLLLQQRQTARERNRAEENLGLLQEVLKRSDPYQTKGEAVTVRELLEWAAPSMLKDIQEPATRAARLDNFGVIYQNLEMFEKARPLLEDALALRQTHLGPRHRDTATSHLHMGAFFHAIDDYSTAESHFKKSLKLFEESYPSLHQETARVLNGLAKVCYRLDRADEGIGYLERALHLLGESGGSLSGLHGEIYKHLGQLYYKNADYPQAERSLAKSIEIAETVYGQDHPVYATYLDELGIVYRRQEKFAQAQALMEKSLVIREKTLGPRSLGVAASLDNLGWLQMKMGDFDDAESHLKQALALRQEALGASITVANSFNNLAGCQMMRGHYLDAAENLQRAIDLHQRFGKKPKNTLVNSLNNLSSILLVLERYGQAAEHLEKALSIRMELFGPNHPNVARIQYNLGWLHMETGDYARAKDFLDLGLKTIQDKIGAESAEAAAFLSKTAELKVRQNSMEEAEDLGRKALSQYESTRGPDHPYVAEALLVLVDILCRGNRFQEAQQLLDRALSIINQALGPQHPDYAKGLYHQAFLRYQAKDYELALDLSQKASRIAEKALGSDHRLVSRLRELGAKANNKLI